MSRVLVIGTDNPFTHAIGDALSAAKVLPLELCRRPDGSVAEIETAIVRSGYYESGDTD